MAKVAVIKTRPTELSVDDFIQGIADEQKRDDSRTILKLMKEASSEEPRIWGSALIGFGDVRVKSPTSGREVDWFRIGFAPRKANFSLYLTGSIKRYEPLLQKLGKHKTGMGCLYITRLSDIDIKVLEEIIKQAAKEKWNH